MSWSPSPYPYPTNTPSSAPYSFSYQPTPIISASPEVVFSYVPMQTTYSASPGPRVQPLSISTGSTNFGFSFNLGSANLLNTLGSFDTLPKTESI